MILNNKERFRFDWYSASINCRENDFIEAITEEFPGVWFRACRPVNQYESGLVFEDQETGQEFGKLSFGGNQGAVPFFEAQGSIAHEVALFIRRVFPVHRVARLDVCLDFDQPGLYDRLYPMLAECAARGRVTPTSFNDNFPEHGRTLRLGATSSAFCMVMYEKGKQMAKVKGVQDASPDWVRLEFRVRPHSKQKGMYAALQPWECLGGARWARSALEAIAGAAPAAIVKEGAVKRGRLEKAAWVIENHWKSFRECSDEELLAMIRAKRNGGSGALEVVTSDRMAA